MSVRVFLKTKRSNSEEKYRFTHHPPPHLHHRLLPRCPHLRSPLHPAGTKTADANSQCLFRISRKVRVPSWKCVVERSLNSGLPRSESQSRLMYHKLQSEFYYCLLNVNCEHLNCAAKAVYFWPTQPRAEHWPASTHEHEKKHDDVLLVTPEWFYFAKNQTNPAFRCFYWNHL